MLTQQDSQTTAVLRSGHDDMASALPFSSSVDACDTVSASREGEQAPVHRSTVPAFAGGRYDMLTRAELITHYVTDGAERAGHTTRPPPPRPETHQTHTLGSGGAVAVLRVLQWNINCLCGAGDASGYMYVPWRDVWREIATHNADVVVLNEFGSQTGWYGHDGFDPRDMTFVSEAGGSVKGLADALEREGYVIGAADVEYPTVVATRLPVVESEAVRLSHSRGAAFVRLLVTPVPQEPSRDADESIEVDVYGTHLCHVSASNRRTQASRLLDTIHKQERADARGSSVSAHVLVAGDLNQQRSRDLAPSDWAAVCRGKSRRGSGEFEDGVDEAFRAAAFTCCFDEPDAARNWPRDATAPPPTHWTSTAIDFAYARRGLECIGVYVSSSNLSDHRPVITDWAVFGPES